MLYLCLAVTKELVYGQKIIIIDSVYNFVFHEKYHCYRYKSITIIQEKIYLPTNILYFGLFFRLKFLENFIFRFKNSNESPCTTVSVSYYSCQYCNKEKLRKLRNYKTLKLFLFNIDYFLK